MDRAASYIQSREIAGGAALVLVAALLVGLASMSTTASAGRQSQTNLHGARAPLTFSRTEAKAGEFVALRRLDTSSTPNPGRTTRFYLVRVESAKDVLRPTDPRVFFIGAQKSGVSGSGTLRFTVPSLAPGRYVLASWCVGCKRLRSRPSFVVQRPASFPASQRARLRLRVTAPVPSNACPVTRPNGTSPPGLKPLGQDYGNGMLWARLPVDGAYVGRPESDGTFFEKIPWFADGIVGPLAVSAYRIDAAAAVPRTQSIPGQTQGFRGSASWASRVWFTSTGCWQVTGRLRDVTLRFVVDVRTP